MTPKEETKLYKDIGLALLNELIEEVEKIKQSRPLNEWCVLGLVLDELHSHLPDTNK